MEEVKITSGFAEVLDGKCLKCGKGVPYYCEECHQAVIADNARLQYHLTKTIPTEENEIRLHNIIDHFEKIKHRQQTVEINAEDIKAIQELIATKQFLKHKYETYYKLYWEDSVPVSLIEEKLEEVDNEYNERNKSDNNEWWITNEIFGYAEEKLKELIEERKEAKNEE